VIPDGRTPVVVVTGFLGSGKTTLVNRFVSQEPHSLVVVNEFGEIPVDHHLLESAPERTVALPNGCLCCRLRGDLEETLVSAAMRRRRGDIAGFDRVIVETSGLADPGPVAQTLFADPALERDFKLGPVLAVVDAADAENRRIGGDIAQAQIVAADVVVLSKADRAREFSAVEAEVRALNPAAQQVRATFGGVDPEIFRKVGGEPRSSASAAHPDGIRSFVFTPPGRVSGELLERFLGLLADLRGADLLRVKGIVAVDDGRFVAVQGVRHVFDRLRPVAAAAPTGLTFITRRIDQNDVRALWEALSNLKEKA
jgi:G3E family GTPase